MRLVFIYTYEEPLITGLNLQKFPTSFYMGQRHTKSSLKTQIYF